MEPKQIQQKVIDYVIDMRDNRRLSPNTISLRVSALQTFFLINDIEDINWPKIKRFKGEFYTVAEDRPYRRDEISALVNTATSLRDKSIILLLSSSGLRVGGLVKLQLKHVKPIAKYHIYQFEVYKSSREAYISFCTPETRSSIDEYLAFRERMGEKLTRDSPLFRMEFETQFGARAPARPITQEGTYGMISKLRHKSGIIQKQTLTGKVKSGQHRTEVMTEHGFRKYFSTCLETEGVNPVYIELLLGHDLGLKTIYSKPTPIQLLEGNGTKVAGYLHGIDALIINEDNRLRRKVAEQEHTIQVQLAEKDIQIQDLLEWKTRQEEDTKRFREEVRILMSNPKKLVEMREEAVSLDKQRDKKN
jgi:integrase